MKMRTLIRTFIIAAALIIVPNVMLAQDENTLKQANNPLASVKSLNFHNYYVASMYGVEDASANQLMIR